MPFTFTLHVAVPPQGFCAGAAGSCFKIARTASSWANVSSTVLPLAVGSKTCGLDAARPSF